MGSRRVWALLLLQNLSGGFSATAFRTGRQVFAGNAEGDRDPWAWSASPLTTVEKPPVCMLTDPEEL